MKAVKLNQPEHSKILPPKEKVQTSKRTFIRHSTDLKTESECRMYAKRNYMSHQIIYSADKKNTPFEQILKRNSKYIRRITPYPRGFNPRLNIIKQLKSLKTLDLLMDDYTLLSWMSPKEAERLLKVILRSSGVDEFRINRWELDYCQRLNFRKIEYIKSLWIRHEFFRHDTEGNAAKVILNQLPDLCGLKCLTSITLDFGSCLAGKNLLHQVFLSLSDLEHLTYLRIHVTIKMIEKEPVNLSKKIMENYAKLLSLYLKLNFYYNRDCGPYLTKILPLKNLENLTLDLHASCVQISSDIPDFVASLKNLKQFNYSYHNFINFPHEAIFKSLQKLKKLEKISAVQVTLGITRFFYPFEQVNKAIQMLKGLKKLEISFGDNFQKPRDFYFFLDFLMNHKFLEEVKIRLVTDPSQLEEYSFEEDFYQKITSLLQRLRVFVLTLKDFPRDVAEKVLQMFLDANRDPLCYRCIIYDTHKNPLAP